MQLAMHRRFDIIWEDDWPMALALICIVTVALLILILRQAHPSALQFLPLFAISVLGIILSWMSIAWPRRCRECGGPLKRLRLREIPKNCPYYVSRCQVCSKTRKVAMRWQGALTRFPIHDNYLGNELLNSRKTGRNAKMRKEQGDHGKRKT